MINGIHAFARWAREHAHQRIINNSVIWSIFRNNFASKFFEISTFRTNIMITCTSIVMFSLRGISNMLPINIFNGVF